MLPDAKRSIQDTALALTNRLPVQHLETGINRVRPEINRVRPHLIKVDVTAAIAYRDLNAV